jgi:SAM-dependent methyltransferase
MNKTVGSNTAQSTDAPQLGDTRAAFDSVAADYDGPRGNNLQIQDMRAEMWRWLERVFRPGSKILDLGCGTGLDALHLAHRGLRVTATDWSPLMVKRTIERIRANGVEGLVNALNLGAHELQQLPESGSYDGAYSNLGPLNCVPSLGYVSTECARLLKPRGILLFTVIGRYCPWEIAHYLRLGRWERVKVRFARRVVPVGMNNHTIWTRYYSPREFYRAFRSDFSLLHIRGVCLFAPPPYLTEFPKKFPRLYAALRRMDRLVAGWPVLRAYGDHFLIVMRKR